MGEQDDNVMKEAMNILRSTLDEGVPEATNEIGNMNLLSPADHTQNFIPSEDLHQPQTSNQSADTGGLLSLNACPLEGQGGQGQIDPYAQSSYHVASSLSPKDEMQSFEFSGAPGLGLTLSANSFAQECQNRPRINILKIVPSMRFRYDSEQKKKTTPAETDGDPSPARDRSLGKIELINVDGEFELKIKLVSDTQGNPHANQLHLTSQKEGYSQHQDDVILRSCQKTTQMTYELPKCSIIRAKKTSSALAASIDCRRVRLMFECTTKSNQPCLPEISDEIIDSKAATDSITTLVHVNPLKTRFSTPVEVTLLGNNITTKHKVFFYQKNSGNLISDPVVPHLCHKKSAVVVKTPMLPMFQDQDTELECEIVLWSEKDGESNRKNFTFCPDLVPRPAKRKLDDENNPSNIKEKIRHHIESKKGRSLQSDSAAGEQEEEEPRTDDEIYQIAFDVAQGEIRFDELLCQRLGMCPEFMLQKDYNDYTPLALAITSGAFNVAEAFLSRMSPGLADDLLKQRLTNANVTHLLLMAFCPDGKLPLPLLKVLLEAGSDPEELDTDGNSLLHLLICNEKHATLEAILSSKDQEPFSKIAAVLDHTNSAGFAPLHEAVHGHQRRAVAALLSAGANVNVVSRSSQLTCLHYAALKSDAECAVEMTRLLLTGPGLKINERTLEGKTATDIAEERKNQKLLDLLKSSGGVNLFEPYSEDEEEEEEEMKESGATAAALQESVSLEEAHERLLEALSAEHFRALGRDLLSVAENRLLERAASPGSVFLRLVAAKQRKGEKVELSAALRRLELMELAELVANARVT